MVQSVARQRLKIPVTLLIAVAIGIAVAVGVHAIPLSQLEAMVIDSGLPAVISSAEPPLGMTARMVIEGTSGAVAGLAAWLLMLIILGVDRAVRRPRHIVAEDEEDWDIPVIRRADAHPDAPPRPPLRANRDLGTPFLEIRAPHPDDVPVLPEPPIPLPAEPRLASPPPEQELPQDWDQPLAAFDPGAIPSQPIEPPVRPTRIAKALRPRVFNPYERIETFELTPPRPAPAARPVAPPEILAEPPEPLAAPETDATIQALLARLERGLERKGYPVEAAHPASAPPPQPSPEPHEGGLQDTLAFLRNLATRD
jgi:hypothetical protein